MQLLPTLLNPNLQSDVPEKWRAKALSQVDPSSIDKVWIIIISFQTYQILIRSFQRHSLPGCYYRDSDFCFLDDNTGKFPFIFSLAYVFNIIQRGITLISHLCRSGIQVIPAKTLTGCGDLYMKKTALACQN